MKNKIEILAPAGGIESLEAAVRSGADAVYLGAKDFSARASALNFSEEELCAAIDYCHIRGVKAYLTVNTLMFDSELQRALDLISSAYAMGIDAVIVQDIGLASLLRKHLPDLRLHGSTQMSIHTPSGAKALWEMGFARVVLSRELSLSEIKEIRESCPIELEVFVHGALCMSVSGQCYFSAILGGRSGNRGMCAQPCRLPFSIEGGSDHALSLKDNSLIEYIKELQDMGVTSAKIEGRMKRPEYVSAAVRACTEKRDTGYVTEDTKKRLEGVFSRTGFTNGYLLGKRSAEMFGYRRKEDVTAGSEKLLSEIRTTYKDELQRIPVSFEFTLNEGKVPTLSVSDGENFAYIQGDSPAERARNLPLDGEKVTALLKKCGGTPFYANNIICHIAEGLSLPASAINQLRRQAVTELTEIRKSSHKRAPVKIDLELPRRDNSHRLAACSRARFADTAVPKEFDNCSLIFVPLMSSEENLKKLMDRGFDLGVDIPRGMFGRESAIRTALLKVKELGITHALASNIGAVYLAKELGFTIHGGAGLNITNTASLLWAEEYGIADTQLSIELSHDRIARLGGNLPRGIIAAGYLPLMLCRCCPGLLKKGSCSSCDKHQKMQDRLGKSFIYTCDGNCTEILNSVPLLIPDKINSFFGIDFYDFHFSVENSVEKVENILSFSSGHQNSEDFTRGLYYRGVK